MSAAKLLILYIISLSNFFKKWSISQARHKYYYCLMFKLTKFVYDISFYGITCTGMFCGLIAIIDSRAGTSLGFLPVKKELVSNEDSLKNL